MHVTCVACQKKGRKLRNQLLKCSPSAFENKDFLKNFANLIANLKPYKGQHQRQSKFVIGKASRITMEVNLIHRLKSTNHAFPICKAFCSPIKKVALSTLHTRMWQWQLGDNHKNTKHIERRRRRAFCFWINCLQVAHVL